MKKFILKIIICILIIICIPTINVNANSSKTKKEAYNAYFNYIKENIKFSNIKGNGKYFGLLDVNGNDIDELFLITGDNIKIFIYNDGKIEKIIENDSCKAIFCGYNKITILNSRNPYMFQVYNYGKKLQNPWATITHNAEGYFYREDTISKSEYIKRFADYFIDAPRMYEITRKKLGQMLSPSLNVTKIILKKGKSKQLILYRNDLGTDIKCSSSNKLVATVNINGKVTAKKAGTTTITTIFESKKYTCKVTVID